MFVAATIYRGVGNRVCPVKLRNMSSTGALIEGDDIPDPGLSLALRRGSLQADGKVAWKVGSKAGVAFTSPIQVKDWLGSLGSPHQARVDLMVAEIKASKGASSTAIPSKPQWVELEALTQLRKVRADIGVVALDLARDASLVANHPEIQMLDISMQKLDELIAQLGGS